MGVAELGVPEVPFAEETRHVAGLAQDLGDGDLVGIHTGVFHRKGHGVHAAANRIAAGLKGGPGGGTGRLGVHAHEVDAVFGHLVHDGCFETPDGLDFRDSDFTKGRIIPHDMNNVRRGAIFLFQLGQLLVYLLVLGCPLLAVLGFKDIMLSVVDDLAFCVHHPGSQSKSHGAEHK